MSDEDLCDDTPRTWTVIGYWDGDDAVPVGVVLGDHPVYGGRDDTGDGLWATSVECGGGHETAMRFAVVTMEGELGS